MGFVVLSEPLVDHSLSLVNNIRCHGKTQSQLQYIYFPWEWVGVGNIFILIEIFDSKGCGAMMVLLGIICRVAMVIKRKESDNSETKSLITVEGNK